MCIIFPPKKNAREDRYSIDADEILMRGILRASWILRRKLITARYIQLTMEVPYKIMHE